MFDQFRLKEALVRYKQDFVAMEWKNEKYKWEAVKWFQDHWDVNATDFPFVFLVLPLHGNKVLLVPNEHILQTKLIKHCHHLKILSFPQALVNLISEDTKIPAF